MDPERDAAAGAAGNQETDASVLVARVVLSAAAIALFGAFGWLVTELLVGDFNSSSSAGGDSLSTAGLPSVPAPPNSQVTFEFDRPGGRHVRYESLLGMAEIDRFYTTAMTEKGWKVDASLGPDSLPAGPLRVVKTFARGTARCIMAAESKARSGTAVTILLVRQGGRPTRAPNRMPTR